MFSRSTGHREHLVLYALISVAAALVAAFLVLSARLYIERSRLKQKANDSPDRDDKSMTPFSGAASDEILADLEAEGLVSSSSIGAQLLQSHYSGNYDCIDAHTHEHQMQQMQNQCQMSHVHYPMDMSILPLLHPPQIATLSRATLRRSKIHNEQHIPCVAVTCVDMNCTGNDQQPIGIISHGTESNYF